MNEEEAIRFYCGIGEKTWNHHPVTPGPFACISPIYGQKEETRRINSVALPPDVQVIQDSGAFSDSRKYRLSYEEALQRQIKHASDYDYTHQITHRASYDYLFIDEKWIDGTRHKARWSEHEAEEAVQVTIDAARYLTHHQEPGIHSILSAQGVSAQQYLRCAQQIVPFLEPGDIFGLGGFCIIGKMPRQYLPVFLDIIKLVIPFLGKEHVRRVHIWGVCFAEALGELLRICDKWDIRLSTDSVGPSTRPVFGNWGYAEWIDHSYDEVVKGLTKKQKEELKNI